MNRPDQFTGPADNLLFYTLVAWGAVVAGVLVWQSCGVSVGGVVPGLDPARLLAWHD